MKVRWTDESLRLRITPAELAALERGEVVEERLGFDGGGEWGVVLDPTAGALGAGWEDGLVRVGLAPADVRWLTEPDVEGVYGHDATPRLLVEKDFPCAHPHAPEAQEPESQRFDPTPAFLERKSQDPIGARRQ